MPDPAARFRHVGLVDRYPGKGGWFFVPIPNDLTEPLRPLANRGLIPVVATVGHSSWSTSLLPKGDGILFIALNAAVRRAESIDLGDEIEISFTPR